jgi:DNA mismatch repair protein MutL
VHLFIEMPRDAVDVNVHPTKAEVRFRDQSHLHQVVRRAVSDALGVAPVPPVAWAPMPVAMPSTGEAAPGGSSPGTTLPLPHGFPGALPNRWGSAGPVQWVETAREVGGAGRELADALGGALGLGASDAGRVVARDLEPLERATAAGPTTPLIPLGQFRDTFILAVDDDGIAIIDQHVAHERILFERITERLTSGRLESQRVLEPVLVELSPGGCAALVAHAADLDRLGFEVEEFGGGAVRVSAFPALLARSDCETTVRALAEDLDGLDRGAAAQDALQRIAATMACHAAVKAHDPLTPEKMRYLIEELRRTAYSTICPHGRPVMLRLGRRELEKQFQRI